MRTYTAKNTATGQLITGRFASVVEFLTRVDDTAGTGLYVVKFTTDAGQLPTYLCLHMI